MKVMVVFCLLATGALGLVGAVHAQTPPSPASAVASEPAAPPSAAPLEVQVVPAKPYSYVCLEHRGPYVDYLAVLAEYRRLLAQTPVRPSAPLMTLYWNSPLYTKPSDLVWDVGHALGSGAAVDAPLKVKKFPYRKLAVTIHKGSYLTAYQTINALYAWIAANGLKPSGGPCVEKYLDSSPLKVPDEEKRTEIQIPVE